MASIIAQLTRELNSRLSESEIRDLVFDTADRLVDSGRFNSATTHGIQIMAKEFITALNRRSD